MAELSAKAQAKVRDLGRKSMEAKYYRADMTTAANNAIQPFIGRIRSMLLQNFKASGIESDTGNLEKGVKTAHVWCNVNRDGQIVLLYGLGKDLKPEVYKYGQALASGAVRAPMRTMNLIDLPQRRVVGKSRRSVLGEKAKKSIKAAVLGHKPLSARSEAYLEKGANRAVGAHVRQKGRIVLDDGAKRIETEKSVKVGQVTIIKPRMYFQLTAAQVATFQDEFMALLDKYLAPKDQPKQE
jgi:hypothetical protein